MLPPMRYVLVSAAIDDSVCQEGDCSFDGGDGSMVSAYFGKY